MNVRRVLAPCVLLFIALVPASAAASSGPPIRPEETQVERLYRAVFDRSPDAPGFAYWFRLRSTTVSLESIAAEFITSPEFAEVAGAPTDADFIDRVYRNVLDRAPDQGGANYWQQQMVHGLTRSQLVVQFSESAEFVATTGTELDPLPPFRSTVSEVDPSMLGSTWRPGCPVSPADLSLLTVSVVGFDGRAYDGELIVHRSVADSVVQIFDQLYQHRYPIERMEPVSVFDGDDDASMAANNSSAFNCRPTTGGTRWARHAFGMAIGLNPAQNPYVSVTTVLPPAGADFIDRAVHHPAMIRQGDVVVDAFAAAGWRWGGDFSSITDWQHFER